MSKECFIDAELPIGFTLSVVMKHYYGAFTKFLEPFGIDRYFSLLMIVDGSEGKLTQQCACDLMHMDKVSMVRALDYLDSKGFVSRSTNPDDRRQHFIELTPKAKEQIASIRKSVMEINNIALGGFTPEEKESFYKMLKRLDENVSNLPSNPVTMNVKKSNKKK